MSRPSKTHIARAHLLAAVAAVALAVAPFWAKGQPAASDKLPRFASLRSGDVNLRVGPGESYPIEWVYKRKDMPVQIIEEFENWRRIQDWQGSKGWVLDRMLTSKREVIVNGAVRPLYRSARPGLANRRPRRARGHRRAARMPRSLVPDRCRRL